MVVHLAVAGDVFDGVLFCAVLFSQEMSWIRSGTELSQFLRILYEMKEELLLSSSFQHWCLQWIFWLISFYVMGKALSGDLNCTLSDFVLQYKLQLNFNGSNPDDSSALPD